MFGWPNIDEGHIFTRTTTVFPISVADTSLAEAAELAQHETRQSPPEDFASKPESSKSSSSRSSQEDLAAAKAPTTEKQEQNELQPEEGLETAISVQEPLVVAEEDVKGRTQ